MIWATVSGDTQTSTIPIIDKKIPETLSASGINSRANAGMGYLIKDIFFTTLKLPDLSE